MKILLLATAFNGLTQRVFTALEAAGHDVSVELAISPESMLEAVELFQPHIIFCPFLKEKVPAAIWQTVPTIIIHPGIVGDRGPSSLDWAIMTEETEWGVTAIEAVEKMDAGPVWAAHTFPMRHATKGSIYRNEVTEAAVDCIFETLQRFESGQSVPQAVDANDPNVKGRLRPLMKQRDRKIDWVHDNTETILRKIRAADPAPGLQDELCGRPVRLFGAHPEDGLRGAPKSILAQRHGAICIATIDGALWITHLKAVKPKGTETFKLPAVDVLGLRPNDVPTLEPPLLEEVRPASPRTWREIWYEERGPVGIVHFDFYNGAMGVDQCERLRQTYVAALQRPTRIIVLVNHGDIWSNGIHLNLIEAAECPALDSWRNILAIDDLIEAIITNRTHLTVAAVNGNAGAGGAILALAADHVVAREGVIFNPHYRAMGLFGSEYWTYLLPKRVGPEKALDLMNRCLPLDTLAALEIGFIDEWLPRHHFIDKLLASVERLAIDDLYFEAWEGMVDLRDWDEERKQLSLYRAFELSYMWQNFYAPNSDYHEHRRQFVYKRPANATPLYIAKHRRPDYLAVEDFIPGSKIAPMLPDPTLRGIQSSHFGRYAKKNAIVSHSPFHIS